MPRLGQFCCKLQIESPRKLKNQPRRSKLLESWPHQKLQPTRIFIEMALLGRYLPDWFTVPRRGRTYTYVRRTGGALTPTWLKALIFLLIGGFASTVVTNIERSLFEKNLFYPLIGKNLIEVSDADQLEASALQGKMIHLNAPDLVAPDAPTDPLFHIGGFDRSVRLKRNVEFCEWREYSTEHCHKEGRGDDEREVCSRTYYYTKDWRSNQQTSMLFDQPFGHQNPSRPELMGMLRNSGGDAYNGGAIFNAPNVFAAHRGSPDGLLQLDQRFVNNFDWFKPRMTPSPRMLTEFNNESPVAARQGEQPTESNPVFRYIGGGYFLSPYSPGMAWQVLRGLGMAWDGSLLDFQIADLFSKCEAGDVRVSFDVLEAGPISVIGRLGFDKSSAQAEPVAHLDAINPSWLLKTHGGNRNLSHSNEPIAIVRPGRYSSRKLLSEDVWRTKMWSRLAQLAFFAFCLFYSRSSMPFTGSPWAPHIAFAAIYTFAVYYAVGTIYWAAGTASKGQWSAWMAVMAALGTWMWKAVPALEESLVKDLPVQMEGMDGKKEE